ncbi:MAG: type IV secretion system DNA-binding domain-containing protein [Planctomycetaceae bacterium]|nr:type IV secretion system DNA-binding domain-containing protein [Planctomycetaceae bacterium]
MFSIFPAQSDDLLNREALPPTDQTELNYRTRPLTGNQELRIVLLLFLGILPVLTILGVSLHFFCWLIPFVRHACVAGGCLFVGFLFSMGLTGALQKTDRFYALLLVTILGSSLIWHWCAGENLHSLRVALVVTWITSSLIARQVAAWYLASPSVNLENSQRWRVNLPRLIPHGLSLDCPELLTYTLSPLLLIVAWILSLWLLIEFEWSLVCWPFIFVASLWLIWFGWHLLVAPIFPFPHPVSSLSATWRGLIVFITYDPYQTPAAGLFRFPTRWLRSPLHRAMLLLLTLVLLAFGCGAKSPDPFYVFQEGGSFSRQILTNLFLISVSGPLLFFWIFWFCAGSLLARFERELSSANDQEQSIWDNYVDRIINSADELEREHLLIGTSEVGDFPVLVHREIYNQHGHLLGDSGSSKTALGITPQATQMIARADSTVVIIDLKGDRALFESCRREAARTRKMRFRWLSNEVGLSSFGFNPFLQSHNTRLSVEQFSQQLLQGLSLDYGLQYGAGYFTAMNEIVLNNVLRETGARSFRELSQHLTDRNWYKSIGYEEDWKQARHLGSLVKRLAGSQSINLTPEMYPECPAIQQQAIDASNLYAEPQVVYLWLRSAVEPTNAPAIARLFLWSMFTAASHQPADRNRVYFYIDEMQQIISDGIKLIFEQYRDLGGTIIGAHQTASQLRKAGGNLSDTIDSCTAFKQVFRASDLASLERLEKLSGKRKQKVATWYQPYERGSGDLTERYAELYAVDDVVRVTEEEQSRHPAEELQALSSRPQSSLVRFTFDSGYTQFGGKSVPLKSEYHISYAEYLRRRQQPWPQHEGAFDILPNRAAQLPVKESLQAKGEQDFGKEFEERGRALL